MVSMFDSNVGGQHRLSRCRRFNSVCKQGLQGGIDMHIANIALLRKVTEECDLNDRRYEYHGLHGDGQMDGKDA